MKHLLLAFVTLAVVISPMAFGGSGSIVLNKSTGNASVNEGYNLSVNITGPSVPLVSLALNNASGSVSLNSSTSIYANLSGAIASRYSRASVSDLFLSYYGHMLVIGDTILYNMSMTFIYNVTGAYSSGAWNLSWRSASFYAPVGGYFKIMDVRIITRLSPVQLSILSGILLPLGCVLVNMSGMSVPLHSWVAKYSPSTNTTSFTCTSRSFLYSRYNGSNASVTVYADPSYSIITEGYAVPYCNDIVYQAKSTIPSSEIYAGAAAVIIIAVIAGSFVRKKIKT